MGIAVNFGVANEFLSHSFLFLFFVFAPVFFLIIVKNCHLAIVVNYHWLARGDAWEDGREVVECDGEDNGMEVLTQKSCPLLG